MKPEDQVRSYKAIVSRVDGKAWRSIWKIADGENLNNAICEYCAKVKDSTYESRVFQYAAFPRNGIGWDGRAVTFPMPSDWKWYGKEVTLAVATVTHSVCF